MSRPPCIALPLVCLLAPGAHATTLPEAPRLETVTVTSTATGSRANQRTVVDSPTPIDVISNEQLLRTGRAELSEAIAKLLPSFNFGTNIAGFQSGVRPLSNRSLGPAYTLVLVNGKRRHNSALPASGSTDNSGANAVDIDMIPVSAVSHIEVLKDSAAAQYGADAVAGVINVILKDVDGGGHYDSSYGQLYSGQGATLKLAGDQGFALGDGGFLHLSGEARKRGTAHWIDKADPGYRAYFEDDRQAAWDHRAVKNGDPDLRAFNLGYNAELPLSGDLRLYSFATYAERKLEAYNNYRLPNSNASIPELFPDGYFPLNNLKDTDYQWLLGARGVADRWAWDLSTSYGRNKNQQSSDLTLNPTYGPASPTSFDDLATLQFDQWVNNLDIRRSFDGLFGLAVPTQVSAGLEHRWEHLRTFAGDPIAYGIGPYTYPATLADGRPNPLYALANGQTAVGAQAALTIRPEDEADVRRNVYAAYVGLGLDLTPRWYLGGGARLEHYADATGRAASFKLNSRYGLTDSIAVRGTLGSGLRAPSLTQTGYTVSDNRTALDANGNVVPALRRTVAPGSAAAQAFGGGTLDPETSRNAGLGLTWQPARRTQVTLDAYMIDIDDRILLTENLYDRRGGSGAVGDVLASLGLARTTWINYYTNAFDTRTRGIDLVGDHTQAFGAFGEVRWTLGFNWNKTTVRGTRSTPQGLAEAGLQVVGHSREGDLVAALPETKWVLGGQWMLGNFTGTLQTTRYGSVETWQQNPAQDRRFGAKWITDLDLSYLLLDSLTLSLGGTNLFDVRPDKHGVPNPNGNQAAYGNAPFHPGDGYWYTKLAYDF